MLIKISQIKDHPENQYYFDDMEGGKWEDFLESIQSRGIIEKPILTEDYVLVGGHQRIRACRELGIEEVDCEVRHYNSDMEVLRDLIEMNVQQRGEIICSRIKKARIIKALEDIYGIRNGGDRRSNRISFAIGETDQSEQQEEIRVSNCHSDPDSEIEEEIKGSNCRLDQTGQQDEIKGPIRTLDPVTESDGDFGSIKDDRGKTRSPNRTSDPKTTDDIAAMLGVSKTEYKAMKRILKLLPGLQEMVSEDEIPFRTAAELITKLTDQEQEKLLASLPYAQKFTQKQIQSYIDQMRGLEQEKAELEAEGVEAQRIINESGDAKEYLRLKEKLDTEQQKARQLHEKNELLKKQLVAAKNGTSDQLKVASDQLKEANEKARRAKAETIKAQQDLEKLRKQLESNQTAAESSKEDSKIRRTFGQNMDPAKVGYNAGMELQMESGGFLSRLRGFEVDKYLFQYTSSEHYQLIVQQLTSIIAIAQNILAKYEEESKCKAVS